MVISLVFTHPHNPHIEVEQGLVFLGSFSIDPRFSSLDFVWYWTTFVQVPPLDIPKFLKAKIITSCYPL